MDVEEPLPLPPAVRKGSDEDGRGSDRGSSAGDGAEVVRWGRRRGVDPFPPPRVPSTLPKDPKDPIQRKWIHPFPVSDPFDRPDGVPLSRKGNGQEPRSGSLRRWDRFTSCPRKEGFHPSPNRNPPTVPLHPRSLRPGQEGESSPGEGKGRTPRPGWMRGPNQGIHHTTHGDMCPLEP